MKIITVRAETYEAMRAFNLQTGGRGVDDSVAKHNPDGTISFPVADATFNRLEALRFPGETFDDIIFRAVRAERTRMQ